jgi:hypothetical protein
MAITRVNVDNMASALQLLLARSLEPTATAERDRLPLLAWLCELAERGARALPM